MGTPELSLVSPWLSLGQLQTMRGLNDEAYETMAAQLLARLGPDSIGSAQQGGGLVQVQFTGIEGHVYAIQRSADLANWATISVQSPTNGSFWFGEPFSASSPRFYRSVPWTLSRY